MLFEDAVFVRDLNADDAAVEASEVLDEQAAAAEEFDEVDAIGETIGIDVAKNDHGHDSGNSIGSQATEPTKSSEGADFVKF